jgi:FtsH-binding integral membrane protein
MHTTTPRVTTAAKILLAAIAITALVFIGSGLYVIHEILEPKLWTN